MTKEHSLEGPLHPAGAVIIMSQTIGVAEL